MGVVAFRIKNKTLPVLFVANDQVANLMLVAVPDEKSPLGIRFEDRAPLVGLAFDGEGESQACMGVAVGDVDQNGMLDLVVTNYYDEPNTLYLQQMGGIFRDATKASGLVAPSLKMLGFGAQCFDARHDGVADLLVLNGHIDDMSHKGIPFRMRAQFFTGDGRAHFMECQASDMGDFFESECLGRALALLDFDRDGRQDFVATDLEKPASLQRNACEAGSFLTLALVGTQSHRDAIGAEVVATVAGRSWTRQLTAGCGYMATNERLIHFGLGAASQVDRLEITWPSGIRQTHVDVPANARWLAIVETSLEFRFKHRGVHGQFCYIDAYMEPSIAANSPHRGFRNCAQSASRVS